MQTTKLFEMNKPGIMLKISIKQKKVKKRQRIRSITICDSGEVMKTE
jgi:hypothetical protein